MIARKFSCLDLKFDDASFDTAVKFDDASFDTAVLFDTVLASTPARKTVSLLPTNSFFNKFFQTHLPDIVLVSSTFLYMIPPPPNAVATALGGGGIIPLQLL